MTDKVREWWRGGESRGLAPGDLKAKKREGRKCGSVAGTNGREVRLGWRWREEKENLSGKWKQGRAPNWKSQDLVVLDRVLS